MIMFVWEIIDIEKKQNLSAFGDVISEKSGDFSYVILHFP